MAADGSLYFATDTAKLYFGIQDSTFYTYHLEGQDKYLQLLLHALPSMPLNYQPNLQWHDYVPYRGLATGFKGQLIKFAKMLFPSCGLLKSSLQFSSSTQLHGTICNSMFDLEHKVTIDLAPLVGFKSIQLDNLQLLAIDENA